MSMGYRNGKIVNVKHEPADEGILSKHNRTSSSHQSKASKRTFDGSQDEESARLHNQMIVVVKGLCPCVYPLLRSSTAETKGCDPTGLKIFEQSTPLSISLKKLSQSWIDPVDVASDSDTKSIKRMMPLTYFK
ncbi:hypothetical protein K7432_016730 [Basidiobolus ranarum]|uniref:Uncharacterized protein n=1 Tax=Basidiobolus ranarum TaxID=34480 RepID=A0ABR2VMI8_9FUNG